MSTVAGGATGRARSSVRRQSRVSTAPARARAAPPAVAIVTTSQRRRLAMAINRINDALVVALQQPPPPIGETRFVCNATEAEWNAYVDSEDQAIKANFLHWFEDDQQIHIVEFFATAHERIVMYLAHAFWADQDIEQWLAPNGASENSYGRKFKPDLSFGPKRTTPNAVLAPGVPIWRDFNTIKVEIGISQGWGDREGQLDHKALTVWAPMAGVQYVLCISTDNNYANPEYKLYDVAANVPATIFNHPLPVAPVPIGLGPGQAATVTMDTRRVLGIPAGQPLPANCPNQFDVDLHNVIVEAMSAD